MMRKIHDLKKIFFAIFSLTFFFVRENFPQLPTGETPTALAGDDTTWWYAILFVLVAALVLVVAWHRKNKKQERLSAGKSESGSENWSLDSVDARKELEWFRKHSNSIDKTNAALKKKAPNGKPAGKVLKKMNPAEAGKKPGSAPKEKEPEKPLFKNLPISGFDEISPAESFERLKPSNDQALLSAIEQTQDEYEEDQEVRELAVRILAAFRNQNSVEALAQVALYDLSSNLRSRAVAVLAEFDHESTFETIVLACADPTREVRAAAARALFTVTFNRGDAWKRIAETNDEYRMVQAARAAVESDLVDRSIDRLTHPDHKYAYEAFALLALLIKAGETEHIFEALENHSDRQIKLAILHVLKVVKDERTLPFLHEYIGKNLLPKELKTSADEAISEMELVTA